MSLKETIQTLNELADSYQQPRGRVKLAAFILWIFKDNSYFMQWLLSINAICFAAALYGYYSDSIGHILLGVLAAQLCSGAALYNELLYASKGTAFPRTVVGLVRSLCPDKNLWHKQAELDATSDAIKRVIE